MKMPVNDYCLRKDNIKIYSDVKSLLVFQGAKHENHYDLSVVIPTYRRCKYLKKALESVFEQESGLIKYNVIVVDNDCFVFAGSDTEELLRGYSDKSLMYYQNEKNIGMFGNLNRCIELASSEWVAMLHDDDQLCNDYFVRIARILEKVKSDKCAAYVKMHMITELDGNIVSGNGKYDKIREKYRNRVIKFTKTDYDILGPGWLGSLGAPSGGTLINKGKFLEVGGYDYTHYPSADTYVPEKMVTQYRNHIFYTVGAFGIYCWNDNASLKGETIIGFLQEKICYIEYYENRNRLSKLLTMLFRNEIVQLERAYCLSLIEKGKSHTYENLVDTINDITRSYHLSPVKLWVYKNGRMLYFRVTTFFKLIFMK